LLEDDELETEFFFEETDELLEVRNESNLIGFGVSGGLFYFISATAFKDGEMNF
jgi:hypothetical protein